MICFTADPKRKSPNIALRAVSCYSQFRYMDYKKSHFRNRLLEDIALTDTHPTAQDLYEKLRADFPRVSLATVYRNLRILVDIGQIARVDIPGDSERFEARLENHYHLICDECGAVRDVPIEVVSDLNARVEEATRYRVERHRIIFYGRCESCG